MRDAVPRSRMRGGAVAGEAFRVVEGEIMHQLLVRVVTGDAADARIRSIEAAAIGEAVRLEANVGFAPPVAADDHLPGAVALAAKRG